MSIQVYECRDDGQQDVFLRSLDVPPERPCPLCGQPAVHVISAPALVDVKRDWNDQASDMQRNPYEQAKAQLNNMANESREQQERQDVPPTRITEEAVQTAAKQIDAEQRTRGTRPTPQQKQVAHARKQSRKALKERTQ